MTLQELQEAEIFVCDRYVLMVKMKPSDRIEKRYLYRLTGTNFIFDDLVGKWFSLTERGIGYHSISFEKVFIDAIESPKVADENKTLILFYLNELKKLSNE